MKPVIRLRIVPPFHHEEESSVAQFMGPQFLGGLAVPLPCRASSCAATLYQGGGGRARRQKSTPAAIAAAVASGPPAMDDEAIGCANR